MLLQKWELYMGEAKPKPQGEDVMFEILDKVSEEEDCEVLELPPLHESIDLEALDSLAVSYEIQFEYVGYDVTVKNGTVTVSQ